MNSGSRKQSDSQNAAVSNGGAELRGAVLRISRDDMFALALNQGDVEIALSASAVAEIRSALKAPPKFRDYHTVAEEAKRLKLSEKTLRTLLKEKHAPHYVIESDIRIDPAAMDAWMDAHYASAKDPRQKR